MKTIGIILSYNNPEMTDRLVENIEKTFKNDFEYIVVDNGSKQEFVSKYTTHTIETNSRMVGGFNFGIDIVRKTYPDFDNIWLFTNDCYFEDSDICPLESSEKFLTKYPTIGILHPSESQLVDVCFDVKNDVNIDGVKIVVEYDIVCPIFTKSALEAMNWKFNERLYQGWGIDYESSYLVRKSGLEVGINHQIIINHNTSSTYDKGRDGLHPNRQSFYNAAMSEMYEVLNSIYGLGWHPRFIGTYNTNKDKILS